MSASTLPHVFVVADSISMQYGPYLEALLGENARYGRRTGTEAFLDEPIGANGGDSSAVRDYLEHWVEGLSAAGSADPAVDILLVNCGLHDIKTDPNTGNRQVGEDRYRENLIAIKKASRSLARQLIWIRTTPVATDIHNRLSKGFHRYAEDVDRYNEIADAVMEAIPRIDLNTVTSRLGSPEDIFCDHVHFTDPVRMAHAAFIAGYLAGRHTE